MTTAEVLLTALVAAFFFANNLRLARQAMSEIGLVPKCSRRAVSTADGTKSAPQPGKRF